MSPVSYTHLDVYKRQEYVSANPTGPLHVGHGRGAAVGSSLANLLKAAGYDVTNTASKPPQKIKRYWLFNPLNSTGFPIPLFTGYSDITAGL